MQHGTTAPPKRRPGRPAGDGANREAILDAAKALFSAHGYDGASMRAIASAAGVDPGLIRHFFTDKEGLFAATIADRTAIPARLAAAFDGDRDRLGERLTAAYLEVWECADTGPILRAMVRTAFTSERSGELLHDVLATRITTELAPDTMASDELPLRLMLAGSHLFGVAAARNFAHVEPLAEIDRDRIVAIVEPTIQHYLTGRLPV